MTRRQGVVLGLLGVLCSGPAAAELTPAWVAPIAAKGPPLYAEGRVFVWGFPAGKPGAPYRIHALDARTGAPLWSIPAELEPAALTSEASPFLTLGPGGRSLVLRPSGSRPWAVDAASGARLDPKAAGDAAALQRMAIGRDLVFAVDQKRHELHGLRKADASPAWKTPLPLARIAPATPRGPHAVRVHGELVLVTTPFQLSSGGRVREDRFLLSVFDAATGALRYVFLRGGDVGRVAEPSSTGPNAAFASLASLEAAGRTVYLVIAQTWTAVGRQGRSEAAVRLLAALDLETGRERWTAMPGGELLATEGGEAWVRVRTVDTRLESVNFLAGLDVETGRQLWRRDLPADWPEECVAVGRRLFTTTRTALKDRSKVYTGDRQGAKLLTGGWIGSTVTSSLVVQDVRSGTELGRTTPLPATQMSAPVRGDGFVYVSTIAEMAEGRSGVWAFEVPR